jgi:hypothetical protein
MGEFALISAYGAGVMPTVGVADGLKFGAGVA